MSTATDTPRTDAAEDQGGDSGLFVPSELARDLEAELLKARDQVSTLESVVADYKAAIFQAQDALGEYWVTQPTLPDACRAVYAALNSRHADIESVRAQFARADVCLSDDVVEAAGQLIDELNRRGESARKSASK